MSNMSNIGWFSSAMNMVGTPVEERVIGIHVGDNVYEALSFVCYYVRNVQDEYLVIPERKDGMVILETPKWNPIRQANFVASLNKMAVDQAKKRYPEMEVPNERPFTCLSFARKSFVYFPDLKVYQEVFLKMYLGWFQCRKGISGTGQKEVRLLEGYPSLYRRGSRNLSGRTVCTGLELCGKGKSVSGGYLI